MRVGFMGAFLLNGMRGMSGICLELRAWAVGVMDMQY